MNTEGFGLEVLIYQGLGIGEVRSTIPGRT
jgi:hypothetical protein